MQGTIIVVDDNKGVLSAVKLLLKNSFERIITLTSPITLPVVLREENAQVMTVAFFLFRATSKALHCRY